MIALAKHLLSVLAHKWWVMVIGLHLGVPVWRLIVHDLSKLRPSEARAYAIRFHSGTDGDLFPAEVAIAFRGHVVNNDHHHEYWSIGLESPAEMPMPAVLEMVADWLAASRRENYDWPMSPGLWGWFRRSWPSIAPTMHPKTVLKVEAAVAKYFDCSSACFACNGRNISFYEPIGSPCYEMPCPVCVHVGRGEF